MTIRMTPIRWGLIAIATTTGMYVVFLFTASNPHGDWLIPQQTNSVILSALGYAALYMALAERNDRRDRRVQLETADAAQAQATVLATVEAKLEEVRRHVCWSDAPTEPLRIVGTVHVPQPVGGYEDAYLAGLDARPDAKVLRLDRRP